MKQFISVNDTFTGVEDVNRLSHINLCLTFMKREQNKEISEHCNIEIAALSRHLCSSLQP